MDLLQTMVGLATVFSTLVAIMTFVLTIRREGSTSIRKASGLGCLALAVMFVGCIVLSVPFQLAKNTAIQPAAERSISSSMDIPTPTAPVVVKEAAPTPTPPRPTLTAQSTPVPSNTPVPPTQTRVPPTDTPMPTPTLTPCPPGCILYQADWSKGMDGWIVPQGWKTVKGMLINDGNTRAEAGWIAAPYQPAKANISNYAVEAVIQVIRITAGHGGNCRDHTSYGIVTRAKKADSEEAYWIGSGTKFNRGIDMGMQIRTAPPNHCASGQFGSTLAGGDFAPTGEWQTYRVEMQGNTISVFIDGYSVTKTTSNLYLEGGLVGLWSRQIELNVRAFRIIGL